jgi:hypothetical protein
MKKFNQPFIIGIFVYLIIYFVPFFPLINYLDGADRRSTQIEVSITGFDLLTKTAKVEGEGTENKDFKKSDLIDRLYEKKVEEATTEAPYDENNENTQKEKDKTITYPMFGWVDKLPSLGIIFSGILLYLYFSKAEEKVIYWFKIGLCGIIALCFWRYGLIPIIQSGRFTVLPLGGVLLIIPFLLIVFDKNQKVSGEKIIN